MNFCTADNSEDRMDSSSLTSAPCRIDFGTADNERDSLPVYLRIKPIPEEDLAVKVIDATTVETNHGKPPTLTIISVTLRRITRLAAL